MSPSPIISHPTTKKKKGPSCVRLAPAAAARRRVALMGLFLAMVLAVLSASPAAAGRGVGANAATSSSLLPPVIRGGAAAAAAAVRKPKGGTAATTTPSTASGRDTRQAAGKNKKKVDAAAAPAGAKATAAASTGTPSLFPTDAILGAVAMAAVERAVKTAFVANGIAFPAQLAGCLILFFTLLAADLLVPGLGGRAFVALGPGTALLTKWLPVFFVPGLAMLPLAPSVGSGVEVAKVLLVTGLGFVYSLYTVAFSVLFLRVASGGLAAASSNKSSVIPTKAKTRASKVVKRAAAAVLPPPKAYSDETMALLVKAMLATGLASLAADALGLTGEVWATPLRSAFFFAATCGTYVWGARLPPAFTKAVHPLITSTLLMWGLLYSYGMATDGTSDLVAMLKTYRAGTLELAKAGAGDVLLFLLGPSVVSFAVSMYSRKDLLRQNLPIVVASVLVSSVGALFGTAAFAKLLMLGGTSRNGLMVRLSMLARNVTTALAMPITSMLGGDVSIAVVVVVLTGILGAQYGRRLLDAAGINDPVTRGLAVGCAAQGLGVSSMVSEQDAFPFAAMAMVLTAVTSTCLVSVPAVKDALVGMCT